MNVDGMAMNRASAIAARVDFTDKATSVDLGSHEEVAEDVDSELFLDHGVRSGILSRHDRGTNQ